MEIKVEKAEAVEAVEEVDWTRSHATVCPHSDRHPVATQITKALDLSIFKPRSPRHSIQVSSNAETVSLRRAII